MIVNDDDERLGQILDEVSPLDIGCEALPDPENGELWWFKHPDHPNVFAKFGFAEDGRMLRIWLRRDNQEDSVIILTVGFPTEHEVSYLATLNNVN